MNSNEFICNLKLLGFMANKPITAFTGACYLYYKGVTILVYEEKAYVYNKSDTIKSVSNIKPIKFEINTIIKYLKDNE